MVLYFGLAMNDCGKASGEALRSAGKAKQYADDIGFFGPLSNDGEGEAIFDFLIKSQILFDPQMIDFERKSFVVGHDNSESAAMHMDSKKLVKVLDFYGDIAAVVLSGEMLSCSSVTDAFLAAIGMMKARPVVITDICNCRNDRAYSANAKKCMAMSDLVLLSGDNMPLVFELRCAVAAFLGGGALYYGVVKAAKPLRDGLSREEFVTLLEKGGAFGPLGKPCFNQSLPAELLPASIS